MIKRQTSAKGFAILSAASVICKVLAFIYLPVQAMLVHDSGNGVISAGYKLYAFIYALTNAGLPVVISKFVSERAELGDYRGTRTVFRSAFLLMLSFGILSALFTYFAAGFLAGWCGMAEAKLMFLYIAPTFLFTSVSCALRGYFQGRHNMTPTAVSQIIEQIVNSLMTVLLEVLFFNYAQRLHKDAITYTAAGSALATVLSAAASAVFLSLMYFALRRQRRTECRRQNYTGPTITSASVYRRILKFSIPSIISCIAASAIDIIDTKSCIPLLLSGGFTSAQAYALFGIYSTKYQRLMTLAMLFAAPLVTSMMPSLAAAKARGDYRQFTHIVKEGYKLNFVVVMPIIAGLSFLAKPILTVIFVSQNSGSLMIVLGTWIALLMTTQTIQSGLLIALDKPLVAPATLLIGMAVKAVCNYTLIPFSAVNIYGALIGNAVAWIISAALNQHYIRGILRGRAGTGRYMLKPCFASLIMGGLSLGFYSAINYIAIHVYGHSIAANDLAVLLTIPFGAYVYFKIMLNIGGISANDLKKIPMGDKLSRLLLKHQPQE